MVFKWRATPPTALYCYENLSMLTIIIELKTVYLEIRYILGPDLDLILSYYNILYVHILNSRYYDGFFFHSSF